MLQAPAGEPGGASAAAPPPTAKGLPPVGSAVELASAKTGPAAPCARHEDSPPSPAAPLARGEPKVEQTDTSSGPSDQGPPADAVAAMLAMGHAAAPSGITGASSGAEDAAQQGQQGQQGERAEGGGAAGDGAAPAPAQPEPPASSVRRQADLLGARLALAGPPPGPPPLLALAGPPPPQVALGLALQRQAAALQQAALQHHGLYTAEEVATSFGEGGGASYSARTDLSGSGESGAGADGQAAKKARLVWTQELHNRFINALSHLGLKNAVPKNILTMMNVDGMTRENKYRLYLKKLGGHTEKDKVDVDELQKLHEKNVQQMAQQQAMQQQLTAALASYSQRSSHPYPGLGLGAAYAPPAAATAPAPAAAAGAAAAGGGAPAGAPAPVPAAPAPEAPAPEPAAGAEAEAATTTAVGAAAGGGGAAGEDEGEGEGTATSAPPDGAASGPSTGAAPGGGDDGTAEGLPLEGGAAAAGVPAETAAGLPGGAVVGVPVPAAVWQAQQAAHAAAWHEYCARTGGGGLLGGLPPGAWHYPPLPGDGGQEPIGQQLSVELQDLGEPVMTRMPLCDPGDAPALLDDGAPPHLRLPPLHADDDEGDVLLAL
eukprot:scaffold4.g4595.t1